MRRLFQLLSFLGLTLTIVPAFLVFTGTIAWAAHARLMLLGMILWFISAPLWMERKA